MAHMIRDESAWTVLPGAGAGDPEGPVKLAVCKPLG